MTDRTHAYYVRLVEEEYFGSVTRQDKAAILACFTEEAPQNLLSSVTD